MPYSIDIEKRDRKSINRLVKTDGVELRSTQYGNQFIASLHELGRGKLDISLGMETCFKPDDCQLEIPGWNGCEEHMARSCFVTCQGGILTFKPGCVSAFHDVHDKLEKIEIKMQIIYSPGMTIPPRLIKKSWFKPFRRKVA